MNARLLRIGGVLSLVCLLSSCSFFKKSSTVLYKGESRTTQESAPATATASDKKKPTPPPIPVTPLDVAPVVDTLVEAADNHPDLLDAADTRELSRDITFSGLETQHIKISNYNPFTDNAVTLMLDQLKSQFCYPYPGKRISGYGYRGRSFHSGVDIKATPRDTIRCAFDGVVRLAKPYSGYGNVIVVRHYNGLETVYSHNAKNLVVPGEIVRNGQPVALAGRTGRATTEHLHFEVRVKGQTIDPNLLIDTENHCLNTGNLYLYNRAGKITASRKPTSKWEMKEEVEKNIASQAKTPEKSSSQEPVYYKVKSGDTLSRIAINNKTTVAKICSLNNIKPTKVLQINQKLRVR